MPSPKIVLELKDVSQLAPQTSDEDVVAKTGVGRNKATPAIVVAPAEGPPPPPLVLAAVNGDKDGGEITNKGHHLSVDGGNPGVLRRPSATPSSAGNNNFDKRRRTLRAQSIAIARKAAVSLKDAFSQVSCFHLFSIYSTALYIHTC
jgi:hypothetical protein